MDRGVWALVGGAVCIGFAPVLAKLAVNLDEALAPTSVAFLRLALAVPFLWFLGGRFRYWADGIPGVLFAIDLGIWHWAFEHTTVANATLEANFAVVLTSLVGVFAFKEQITPRFILGVVIALGGMAGLLQASFHLGTFFGDMLGLLTAFAYASYMIAIKARARHSDLPSLLLTSATVGALCLGVTCLIRCEALVPSSQNGMLLCLALTLSSQLLGQGLIAFGLARVPIAIAAAIILIQPVVAAGLSYVWLEQTLTRAQMGFGVLACLGIYFAQRERPSPPKDQPTATAVPAHSSTER